MRVIAGEFKSRRLRAPAGRATRPTSDRLRETLFDILGAGVAGRGFVDLYAGSGGVGIEAWSRGARPVVWIESGSAALAALRANLAELGIAGPEAVVLARAAEAGARALAALPGLRAAGGCDFVFLDPPYREPAAYLRLLAALGRHPGPLRPGATVIAETRRGTLLPENCGRLRRRRVHAQGDSQLVFYQLEAGAAPAGC